MDTGRQFDQFKEMEPRLHPEAKEALKRLCDDPKTTVVILSGSHHSVLDKVLNVDLAISDTKTRICERHDTTRIHLKN